jgi:hypothetical protein
LLVYDDIMNTYGKKKINTGKNWQNPNNRGRRPVRLIPYFNVVAASDQARIRCLLAVISVTLDHDKNEKHEGGYVETFNHRGRLFSRNSRFASCAGTDEGSGD